MNKKAMGLLLVVFSASSQASLVQSVESKDEVEKITDKIPTKYGSLTGRAKSLGIKVDSILVEKIEAEDAEGDPTSKPGDITYSINIDGISSVKECELLGTADITLRGGKYIMESRTANWIVNGICKVPQ